MDANPENVEKKPETGEKTLTEAEKAAAKGAGEAYSGPKNGDVAEKENIFGLSKDKDDYQKVDEDTLKTKDGETIEVVDNKKGGSLLYGETDWETLFSWSNEERTEKAKAGDDSWLANLGFNSLLGGDDKAKDQPAKTEEPKQGASLLDSITNLEWKDVKDFFGDMFGDKKPEGSSGGSADAAKDSVTLPDGTKVAKDGSWVALSPEAEKQAKEAGMDKPVVHKYTDKDGKEVSLEIRDGKVFHVAGDGSRTEVTDQRVTVTGPDGTVTMRDKHTGEVRAQNTERRFAFEQGAGGYPKKATLGGLDVTVEGPGKVVVRDGDNREQEFTPYGLFRRLAEKEIRQRARQRGEAQDAPPPPPKETNVYETNSSGIAYRSDDGSTVAVNMEKRLISIRMKEGTEVLIDQQGQVRVREGEGQPVALDRSKLPKGLTEDSEGNIVLPNGMKLGPDGKVRTRSGDVMDSRTGDVTVTDQNTGKAVTISANPETGTTTVTDDQGRKSTMDENTGVATTTTSDGKPITYNTRTQEFTVGDPSHPDFVVRKDGTTILWDGSIVGPNGEITFENGTYIDEEGNIRFYDGTEIDADGDIRTADGKNFSSKHGTAGHHSTASIAGYANALASSIAGKSNPNPGDIAALQAALGVLGSMAQAFTAAGCLDAYAKVKDSEGNVLAALSKANGNNTQPGSQHGQQTAQGPAPAAPAKTN